MQYDYTTPTDDSKLSTVTSTSDNRSSWHQQQPTTLPSESTETTESAVAFAGISQWHAPSIASHTKRTTRQRVPRPSARSSASQRLGSSSDGQETQEVELMMPKDSGSIEAMLAEDAKPDGDLEQSLPPSKIFSIQVGDRPSHLTRILYQHDRGRDAKTLYIDRDPVTFQDIVLHLQGYHIEPRDGPHAARILIDAQFFGLPRLTAQLCNTPVHICVGGEHFQISRDLFTTPGNAQNYFTLGFSSPFSSPVLDAPQSAVSRPSSLVPSSVPSRSARIFADLLHMLKGYTISIRDEQHRADLLRDARYFHFKGLEQALLPHHISFNLARQCSEIVIGLHDIRREGLGLRDDEQSTQDPTDVSRRKRSLLPAWVTYQRPYVDRSYHTLILEISGEGSSTLSLLTAPVSASVRLGRATFYGETLATMNRLLHIISGKNTMDKQTGAGMAESHHRSASTSSETLPDLAKDGVKVRIGPDADVTIDGNKWAPHHYRGQTSGMEVDTDIYNGFEMVLVRSQWRIRVHGHVAGSGNPETDIILGAVKIDGFTHERARNAARGFLS